MSLSKSVQSGVIINSGRKAWNISVFNLKVSFKVDELNFSLNFSLNLPIYAYVSSFSFYEENLSTLFATSFPSPRVVVIFILKAISWSNA